MIKKDSFGAWMIWIIAASFFFLEYVVRVSPSVMAKQLLQEFNITAYALGTLSSCFYYTYVCMQIPVGTLVDKYNVRWLLGFMALLYAGSTLLFASTHLLIFAQLSRLLIGITSAFAFVGALKLASMWFSPYRFGFLAGATQALGMVGAAAGTGALPILIAQFGWRGSLVLLSFLIAALAIIFIIVARDNSPHSDQIEQRESFSALAGLKIVLSNPMTWINGIIVALLYAPTAAFGELWGPLYIHQVYGISIEQAGRVVSCIFIGWAIGGPIFGWVSDKLRRRKPIIMGSTICSLLLISILLYMPFLPLSLLFTAAFLYGVSNIGVATCYAASCELNPAKLSGTALGFTNMASIIVGGALFQPLLGWLLDLGWEGEYFNGIRAYSTHDFQMTMLILPACLIACFILTLFLKESYGANQRQFWAQSGKTDFAQNC